MHNMQTIATDDHVAGRVCQSYGVQEHGILWDIYPIGKNRRNVARSIIWLFQLICIHEMATLSI